MNILLSQVFELSLPLEEVRSADSPKRGHCSVKKGTSDYRTKREKQLTASVCVLSEAISAAENLL